MTIQPTKNEQDVAQLQKTASSSQSSPLTPGIQQQPVPLRKQTAVPGAGPTKQKAAVAEVFSGAVSAPANESAKRLEALQNVVDIRTEQLKAVRVAADVGQQVIVMKHVMIRIVKNYPPFFEGDEERQKYLMSIDSIRKQIEEMTYPPDPASQSIKKIWSDLFQGVQIPSLQPSGPNEASDEEIYAAYAAVDTIQNGLERRRSLFVQQITPSAPLSSSAAEQVSRGVGEALSVSTASFTLNLRGVLESL